MYKIYSIIICTFHILISCIENTFETWIYWKMQNMCDIHTFIGSYFIHQHIYACVKHAFNTWYSCIKCTNLWMNEFHTIFIINVSHAKFVISIHKLSMKLYLVYLPIYYLGLGPCFNPIGYCIIKYEDLGVVTFHLVAIIFQFFPCFPLSF